MPATIVIRLPWHKDTVSEDTTATEGTRHRYAGPPSSFVVPSSKGTFVEEDDDEGGAGGYGVQNGRREQQRKGRRGKMDKYQKAGGVHSFPPRLRAPRYCAC